METHLKRKLSIILSLNENRKLTVISEMIFNEGLAMLDKEMKVFYKTKQLNVKTPQRKLQLVWDKIL